MQEEYITTKIKYNVSLIEKKEILLVLPEEAKGHYKIINMKIDQGFMQKERTKTTKNIFKLSVEDL